MSKKGWIVGGALLAISLLVLLVGLEQGNAPAFVLFVGRFHPAVVHFPIALLLIAASIELLAPRWPSADRVRPAVPFLLMLGAVSALAAVVLGYFLSMSGGYDEATLSLHFWLGLVVTGVAFVLAMAAAWLDNPGKMFRGILAGLAVLVVFAGHFGGTLARGSGYLTYYLPQPIKSLVGIERGAPEGLIANVDSAHVYADLVQPILDRRCVTCHGPSKTKGDLRLDTREGVEEGGRDGPAFVAGNPAQSEIVRRISLPPYDEDAMPPDGGPPLDVGETEIIRWWIANGASFDVQVADIEETPTAVSTFLARVSQPREPRRSGIYALEVAEPDTTAVAALEETGLLVSRIDPEAPFLRVGATSVRDAFGDEDLEVLRPILEQVAVLDLGHTQVTDAGAAVFAEMPHLTHLHLEGTQIGNGTLEHLRDLEYLEYVNLYATGVSDGGLDHLADLPVLRSVYLWQSRVTPDGADRLRQAQPGVNVNTGNNLALVADSVATGP